MSAGTINLDDGHGEDFVDAICNVLLTKDERDFAVELDGVHYAFFALSEDDLNEPDHEFEVMLCEVVPNKRSPTKEPKFTAMAVFWLDEHGQLYFGNVEEERDKLSKKALAVLEDMERVCGLG